MNKIGKSKKHTLNYGVTLYYQRYKVNKATKVEIGLSTGSLHDDQKQGIMHFFEHMLFKGTHSLTAAQIRDQIRDLVCNLNAHTQNSKMFFTFYQSNQLLGKTLALVAEIFFNSTFPQKEIDKEANVIAQEIARAEDNAERSARKSILQSICDCPYLQDRLGTLESIKTFTTQDFISHYHSHVVPNNIYISAAGSLSFSKFKKLLQKHFVSKINTLPAEIVQRNLFINKQSNMDIAYKEDNKCILQIALPLGLKINHQSIYTLSFIVKALNSAGGRIFNHLREEEGLVYIARAQSFNVEGEYLLNFYAQATKENIPACIDAYARVLKNLYELGVTEQEIERIKTQERLAEDKTFLSYDHTPNILPFQFKIFGRSLTLKDTKKAYNALNKMRVDALIKEIVNQQRIYVSVVGKLTEQELPSLEEIKKKFNFIS